MATRPILATDLDGTLIPLDGDPQHEADLQALAGQLESRDATLIFITGRHFASASQAMEQFRLPKPDWLICDVGTSIFQRQASGQFEAVAAYQGHQDQIVAALPIHALRKQLESIAGLRLQEPEKQGRFKLSFYADAAHLDDLVARIQRQLDQSASPYSIIQSVDPFNGDGLIDLLPATVSKAHALAWWVKHSGSSRDAIVFAGDSGNDLAALTAGYRAIVVGNAHRSIAQQVYQAQRESGWKNRLYLARGTATSGVLEGCRWFGLAEPEDLSSQRLGAMPLTHQDTHFRVWAPQRQSVAVDLGLGKTKTRHDLTRQPNGYFAGTVPGAGPGSRYRYVLDDQLVRPDPASRYQPAGVHGVSQIVDPRGFPWTDQQWQGVSRRDLVIYELHVGAFTREGTFWAAIERLPELRDLGVTAIEIMPVAQSPGRWNWGYDGVDLFAVRNTFGEPDDFKAFVDACHAAGMAVLLDVVYNHVGPEGNYLADFGPYRSSKHHTPWGDAFNYDGRNSKQVRQFVVENAIFWLDEYHLDGLRLDAVHFILDDSHPTILDEIRLAVSEYVDSVDRTLHLMAEANVYNHDLLTDREDRPAYDAIWSDCLMHAIYSLGVPGLRLTDREYRGAGDLADALQYGYVYEGPEHRRVSVEQRRDRQRNEAERPDIESFVTALQNHDAVGNHPQGKRIHQLTSKSFQRAAAGLMLLYPAIPLIFMGEEFAAESPFPFFADFEDPQLRKAVERGRATEYPVPVWGKVLSPVEAETFQCSRCGAASDGDAEMLAWYRDLIALRKQGIAAGWLTAARMTTSHDPQRDTFSLRYDRAGGGTVLVQARLSNAAQPGAETETVPFKGSLLLSSEPNPETGDGYLVLHRNHMVISRS